MRKVTVKLQMRIVMSVDEGIEISGVVNELDYQISQRLKELYSDKITIIFTDGVTEGAACTVLLAKHFINTDEDLIIYNTDQYFKSALMEMIRARDEDLKGII